MASRHTVLSKLAERKRRMGKQFRLWRKSRKRGHLKAFRVQKKAVKKLKGILAKLPKPIDWSGCPPLSYGPIKAAARVALSVDGLYITATTNGTHSSTSWHYKSRAFDGGSDGSDGEGPEMAAQQLLLDTFGAGHFAELFGPLPWYVKNGVVYGGVFPGHRDHLHAAVA